ncbi:MAG: sodium-anion symporter, partial [Chloroflexi bacterium]|nr:sodium-anion symporter [Chloroflexota bacterium]
MTLKRTRLKSELPKAATWSIAPGARVSATANGPATPPGADPLNSGTTVPLTTTSKRRIQRRSTPLEVLQQPLQAGVRKVFDLRRFLLVLALTGVVLLLPTPVGLSVAGHRAFALFVFTGAILALEP